MKVLSPILIATLLAANAVPIQAAVILLIPDAPIPISTTFEGLYIDFGDDLTTNSISSATVELGIESYSVEVESSQPADWDINFFFGGMGIENSDSFEFVRTAVGGPVANLPIGFTLGASSVYDPTLSTSGGPPRDSFAHIGNGSGQFESGVEGYLGFAWNPANSGTPIYGYFNVTFYDDGSVGSINSWAFESIPGEEIIIAPEPSALGFLGLSLAAVILRRRRR